MNKGKGINTEVIPEGCEIKPLDCAIFPGIPGINGIKPQGKPWTLFPTPRVGELNHIFSSAEAEREGGLKLIRMLLTRTLNTGGCQRKREIRPGNLLKI